MSIISKLANIFTTEKRATITATPVSATNMDGSGTNLMYYSPSDSGIPVNQWSGLTCIPVFACIRLIANTMGYLDIDLMASMAQGGKRKATEHPIYNVLRFPNDAMNGNILKSLMESHRQSWGNGFCFIDYDGAFHVKQLLPLLPDRTFPVRLENGELIYRTRVNGETIDLLPYQVLHIRGFSFNGLNGMSPIAMFRQQIGKHMAFDKFGAKIFSNGLNASGIVTHPGNLTTAAQERLREQLTNKLTGIDNAHKVMILEEAMKFEKLSIDPNDAQWIEAANMSREEIAAGIYQVPPHMIGAMARSTNNNIEQQSIDFKTHCLNPLISDWEGELNRKLLRQDEQATMAFRFDLRNLIRGDMAATSAYYKSLSDVLQVNEIRSELGFNPLPYGNVVMVQSQNITLEDAIEGEPDPAPTTPPEAAPPKAEPSPAATDTDAATVKETALPSKRQGLDAQYRCLFDYACAADLSAAQIRQVLTPYVAAVRAMAEAEAGSPATGDNFGDWVDKYCQTMSIRIQDKADAGYECHRCRNAVTRETYLACGVKNVRWEGGDFDGQTRAIAEPFQTDGKRHIYHPPLNTDCRSEIYPVREEK